MGKRLLLFGPPGVGKGTHSHRLAAELGVPHVSTGDMLRSAVRGVAEQSDEISAALARGELVPDHLAVVLVERRLAEADAASGYLLDGFPRTVPQVTHLAGMFARSGRGVDAVLVLEAPEEVLVQRIAGRLTCGQCHRTFNRFTSPPVAVGSCDGCGGLLYERGDDSESVVRRRLVEYASKTAPVLAYLEAASWPVRRLDAAGDAETVYRRIVDAAVR